MPSPCPTIKAAPTLAKNRCKIKLKVFLHCAIPHQNQGPPHDCTPSMDKPISIKFILIYSFRYLLFWYTIKLKLTNIYVFHDYFKFLYISVLHTKFVYCNSIIKLLKDLLFQKWSRILMYVEYINIFIFIHNSKTGSFLVLAWQRSLSYRNQSKSMD